MISNCFQQERKHLRIINYRKATTAYVFVSKMKESVDLNKSITCIDILA
jgi:hypothetical protein